jgi:hypothetical protein
MRKLPAGQLRIPGVYGGVVLLLLILAFLARSFSQGVGDARVSGRYAPFPLFRPTALQNLTLSWNGIALRFSRLTTPALEGVESSESGTDIMLEDNVRLRVTAGNEFSGSLSIVPVTLPGGSPGAPLVIPFTLSGPAQEPSEGSALSWERGGRRYFLSLPPGAHVDAASRLLTLPRNAGAISFLLAGAPAASARVARTALAAKAPRLPDESAMPSPDQMQAAIGGFLDSAYAGWTGTRFSAPEAIWKMPDGSAGFSEDIGVGLLAEAISRGTWERLVPVWSEAVAQQQARLPGQRLPLRTSPYFGNVRDSMRALTARAADEVDRVRGLLAKSDTALFATQGLVTLLEDHGTPDLLPAARSLMTGRNAAGLDTAASLGLLEGLLEFAKESSAGNAQSLAAREVIDRRLFPSVRAADEGLFLESGAPGRSEVKDNLRCGSLLLQAGAALDYSRAAAVGRALIVASLGLGGETGFLPATLTLSSGRISARAGSLAPESVYALLPLDRFVPREISLSRQLGAGSWIWTSAKLISAESTDADAALVIAYPVGVAHYMAIQGIKPFGQVRLHSIPWHSDPAYMKYSDGWTYDAASRTLYLKLTGRAAQEQISIRF